MHKLADFIDSIRPFLFLVLAALAVFGWFWNIVKLVDMSSDSFSLLFGLRVLGVVFSYFGAFLGFF